jgi:hypothetical protein
MNATVNECGNLFMLNSEGNENEVRSFGSQAKHEGGLLVPPLRLSTPDLRGTATEVIRTANYFHKKRAKTRGGRNGAGGTSANP